MRLVRVDAEVNLVPTEMKVEFKANGARLNKSDEEIVVLFEHQADFYTSDDEPAARVSLGHAARFTYDPDLDLDDDAVGDWIFGNVYFMVYPYVRQALQDTCLRLGLPAVVLGYLKRGEVAPEALTILVSSTAYQQTSSPDDPLPLEEPDSA